MEELKDAYMSVLKEHAKPILIEKDSNKVKFDLELNKILENAKKELGIRAKKINNSWYWELDTVKQR